MTTTKTSDIANLWAASTLLLLLWVGAVVWAVLAQERIDALQTQLARLAEASAAQARIVDDRLLAQAETIEAILEWKAARQAGYGRAHVLQRDEAVDRD